MFNTVYYWLGGKCNEWTLNKEEMNIINEKQLQAAMVREFSQRWPEKDGQLWSVRNTTLSVRDGSTQKALGMKAGVADLNFFEAGVLVGIEVKFPGKKHDRAHIVQQVSWGETIEKNGGEYFIVTSIEDFISIIEGGAINSGVYTLEKLKEKLEKGRSQIIF